MQIHPNFETINNTGANCSRTNCLNLVEYLEDPGGAEKYAHSKLTEPMGNRMFDEFLEDTGNE